MEAALADGPGSLVQLVAQMDTSPCNSAFEMREIAPDEKIPMIADIITDFYVLVECGTVTHVSFQLPHEGLPQRPELLPKGPGFFRCQEWPWVPLKLAQDFRVHLEAAGPQVPVEYFLPILPLCSNLCQLVQAYTETEPPRVRLFAQFGYLQMPDVDILRGKTCTWVNFIRDGKPFRFELTDCWSKILPGHLPVSSTTLLGRFNLSDGPPSPAFLQAMASSTKQSNSTPHQAFT